MECVWPKTIYDTNRTYQFYFRYCHLFGHVVCVQMYESWNAVLVPIRMVYWRSSFANIDCTYDTYAENTFYSKQSLSTGYGYHLHYNDNRYYHSVYKPRSVCRSYAFTMVILPLVDWNTFRILFPYTIYKRFVCEEIPQVVVSYNILIQFSIVPSTSLVLLLGK